MTSILDCNNTKRRKTEHSEGAPLESLLNHAPTSLERERDVWHTLQSLLENDFCTKIPSRTTAVELLTKWLQIIAGDKEKLRVFRQWVMPSSDSDNTIITPTISLVPLSDLRKDVDEPEDDRTPPSKASSIDFITNDTPITPRTTPQVLLLQKLIQQYQHQLVSLQKLQRSSSTSPITIPTITLNTPSGNAGDILTVTIRDGVRGQWHEYDSQCTCRCGFTMPDGNANDVRRIEGGGEGEMRFVVPSISSLPSPDTSCVSLVVYLTSCTSPHTPLVCPESFQYGRDRNLVLPVASSDEDSEDTPDSSICDDDDDEERPSVPAGSVSPKQLMTVRERMIEFIHSPNKGTARVIVSQQPPSRVVWKNRRLDTPFKIRVEGIDQSAKLTALAIVVDHKGKLQIDAVENFEEDCNPQGFALFHNLRMTKGTWGKEWDITFVVVQKTSMSTSNPTVLGVSQVCPVVVKTRKNPQIRNSSNGVSRSESPSPVAFVERTPDVTVRKRNRVEDLLDNDPPSRPPTHIQPSSRTGLHSEDMTSLLYAAEIKQQEREFQVVRRAPAPPTSISSSSSPDSSPSPPHRNLLPSIHNGFGSPEPNFANLQGLLSFLEDVKVKHRPCLSIVEQPQLKRDGKVLIVKKGKPFRTPFRLQLRTVPPAPRATDYATPTPEYNPQQYSCVAVLRNDKGEEVAMKNGEVMFDARGIAVFSGLMVMKGTWGKAVQLTFEARWSGSRRLSGNNHNSWPPLRMLVVAETPALQLMCYTKDKKSPS